MGDTQIDRVDLETPRRQLSVRCLRFVVHGPSGFEEIDFRACILGMQSSCMVTLVLNLMFGS